MPPATPGVASKEEYPDVPETASLPLICELCCRWISCKILVCPEAALPCPVEVGPTSRAAILDTPPGVKPLADAGVEETDCVLSGPTVLEYDEVGAAAVPAASEEMGDAARNVPASKKEWSPPVAIW